MSTFGLIGLLIAFAGCGVSAVCLATGGALTRKRTSETGELFSWGGHIGALVALAALTVCCGILVWAFFVGDMRLEYVLMEHSNSTGSLAWLYKLSGLWAGREGSLLFWAWLLSLFSGIVACRNLKEVRKLDSMALLVLMLVLAAFVGVLLFSQDNMPFTATESRYFNSDGTLTAAASMYGMNTLLEHWAMAIHPPTLFVGYAGLTVPFAFAVAALITNDSSKDWVKRSSRYALVSWLFLSVGIGLGSVWAYVVLGWGGYWGWDPVENASLISWLVGVALIHSFTVYRQRGAFKRWSVFCACLTFAFVIVGTFISRSGLVESVHAFEGDAVSLALFLALIIASLAVGVVGLLLRWGSFADSQNATEFDSFASKDAAYYFNNVIMVIFATLVAYLTISSALPSWLPFGGVSVSAGTYNTIARPLGIVYLAILALCPLLSWGRTDPKRFMSSAKLPACCAFALFVALMFYFCTVLFPAYNDIIAGGDTFAEALQEYGPSFYYNGLSVVGFAVASVLFFNALFMIERSARDWGKANKKRGLAATMDFMVNRCATFGGFVSHLGMAVILIGLIGSSMYVTEKTAYLDYNSETETCESDFVIQDYTLKFTGSDIELQDNDDDIIYTAFFDVYQDGQKIGEVSPAVQMVQSTQQQKLLASVLHFPTEDLFVVYRGVSEDGDLSMDVRVNPLISVVWVGFGLLALGIVIASVGRRTPRKRVAEAAVEAPAELDAEADPAEASAAEASVDAEPVEAVAAAEQVEDGVLASNAE